MLSCVIGLARKHLDHELPASSVPVEQINRKKPIGPLNFVLGQDDSEDEVGRGRKGQEAKGTGGRKSMRGPYRG